MHKIHWGILFVLFILTTAQKNYTYKIALVKYNGGGDWYANLETSLPNLIAFCNAKLNTRIDPEQDIVEIGSSDIFNYPWVHLTGHGNIILSQADVENLRNYLLAGGFLHIDDNYGLDPFIRREMKKVFPDKAFVEIPSNHRVYKEVFRFNALPKIHQHDEKPAKGYGIFDDERMLCFYSFESDLGDGWEDASIHSDSEEVREKALKMGANLIAYAFKGAPVK